MGREVGGLGYTVIEVYDDIGVATQAHSVIAEQVGDGHRRVDADQVHAEADVGAAAEGAVGLLGVFTIDPTRGIESIRLVIHLLEEMRERLQV
jgi:hypothetical protein